MNVGMLADAWHVSIRSMLTCIVLLVVSGSAAAQVSPTATRFLGDPGQPWNIPGQAEEPRPDLQQKRLERVTAAQQLSRARDWAAAEPAWRDAVDVTSLTHGPRHPMTAYMRMELAKVLDRLERRTEALDLYLDAIEIFSVTPGMGVANSPNWIGEAEFWAAVDMLFLKLGPQEADQLFRRSADHRTVPGVDLDFHGMLHNLATQLFVEGNESGGERLARERLLEAERRVAFDGSNEAKIHAAAAAGFLRAVMQWRRMEAQEAEFRRREQSHLRDFWKAANHAERSTHAAYIASVLQLEDSMEAETEFVSLLQSVIAAQGITEQSADAEQLKQFIALFDRQGKPADAERVMRRIISLQAGDASVSDTQRFSALYQLGRRMIQQGRYAEAEPLLRQAIQFAEGALDETVINTLFAQELLALSVGRQGRIQEASALFQHIVARFEEAYGAGSPPNGFYTPWAWRMLTWGRPDLAVSPARTAWRIEAKNYGRPEFMAAGDNRDSLKERVTISAMIFLRAAWSEGERLPKARAAHSAEAFEALQFVGLSSAGDGLAIGSARALAIEAGQGDAARTWIAALEGLRQVDAKISAAIPGAPASDPGVADLLVERQRLMAQRDEGEFRLRSKSDFFDLVAPRAVPLADLQRVLGEDEVLLVLSAGNTYWPDDLRRGFVFAVTRSHAAWAEIKIDPDALTSEMLALHGQLANGGRTDTRAPGLKTIAPVGRTEVFDRQRSHTLYTALFGDPEIAGLVNGKHRWIIAPESSLFGLPFAALVTAPPPALDGDLRAGDSDPGTLRKTSWLGLEKALSVVPSVAAVIAQRTGRNAGATAGNVFLGIGDPEFQGMASDTSVLDPASVYRNGVVDLERLRQLRRLSGAGRELKSLAASFQADAGNVLTGMAATERAVKARNEDGSLAAADVIAFATHGLVAGSFEGALTQPALALTPPAVASDVDDGLLLASEIALLSLRARWVILSACDTASGGMPGAEGLSGLARAFFVAGAQTLLVSQWPVDDAGSALLVAETIRLQTEARLSGAASSSAEHMREAMFTLAQTRDRDEQGESFAHPRVWAPFILVSGE